MAAENQSDGTAAVVADARWLDLDPLEFERLRTFVRAGEGRSDASLLVLSHRAIAASLGAVDADDEVTDIRVLGLLLFGKEESLRRFLPERTVSYQVWTGEDLKTDEVFRGPLLRILEELSARVRCCSPRTLREGLAYAFLHHDYSRPGTVEVLCRDGTVEISELDDEAVKNPLLAQAFRRLGIVPSAAGEAE